MDINQAIRNARNLAISQREMMNENPNMDSLELGLRITHANENEQLALWLEELLAYRNGNKPNTDICMN